MGATALPSPGYTTATGGSLNEDRKRKGYFAVSWPRQLGK